jgi:sulfur carrier protein ThiS
MGTVKIEIRTGSCASPCGGDDAEKGVMIEEKILPGMSVRDLINQALESHADLKELVLDKTHEQFFSHVLVLVNEQVMNTSELRKRIPQDGDEIRIVPFMFGG